LAELSRSHRGHSSAGSREVKVSVPRAVATGSKCNHPKRGRAAFHLVSNLNLIGLAQKVDETEIGSRIISQVRKGGLPPLIVAAFKRPRA
jgi:hypothetical protein